MAAWQTRSGPWSAPPGAAALADLRRCFTALGHEVVGHVLGTPDPVGPASCSLLVVDGAAGAGPALDLLRRLRPQADEAFVPVLFLADEPASRLGCLEAGADAFLLRPFSDGELASQARALLRVKLGHDRLTEQAAEINRINNRLQAAYQQFDQELELAQRLQAGFLPQSLPQVAGVRFAAHYLPCGRVGGDFYDVFRLDEKHVGFYVADAMGHGVPASLLTIFVKKGVKPKEVFGNQYRLLPPDEVLAALNRELIDQRLSEHPFITMAYALLNNEEGTLSISRAGHPYPLHVPAQGEPVFWKQEGFLLGVLDASFGKATHRLHPGDKVLLYSDGVDEAAMPGHEPGMESLRACAALHRELPAQEFVARLARELFSGAALADDLTLLAIERTEAGP